MAKTKGDEKAEPQEASMNIDCLQGPATADVHKNGKNWYLMFRFGYFDAQNNYIPYGSKGVNIRLEDAEGAIRAMIAVHNEATGTEWELVTAPKRRPS